MNAEKLSEQLRRTAAAAPTRGVDLDAVVTGAQRVRRHRRIAAATAGLLIVAAGATTGALTLSNGRDSGSTIAPQPLPAPSRAPTSSVPSTSSSPPTSVSPASSATPTQARTPTPILDPPPGWTVAASLPAEAGSERAVVGARIVYWGGGRGGADSNGFGNSGSSFDVASRTWTPMSSSPIQGRYAAATAGSDRLFFVWGGNQTPETGQTLLRNGATYDIATRTWHVLPPAPIDRQPLGAAWDGQRFVVVSNGTVAAYDPALDRWSTLPALPAPSVSLNTAVVQAGSRTYVIGSNRFYLERGASAWESVPELPSSGAGGIGGDANPNTLTAASDGTTVFAAALTLGGALMVDTYDAATRTWVPLPESPVREVECAVPLAVTATSVYVACANVGVYNRQAGTWTDFGDSRGWGGTAPTDVGGNDPVAIGSAIVFAGDPTLIYSPP